MVRVIVTVILLTLLTACGVGIPSVNIGLVQKAIALSLSPTQQQISQQLNIESKPFEINHIKVQQRELILIENLPTYHVQGTYDLSVNLSGRQVNQQQNPFDVYLQVQREAKTWRLAVPAYTGNSDKPIWLTYLIR